MRHRRSPHGKSKAVASVYSQPGIPHWPIAVLLFVFVLLTAFAGLPNSAKAAQFPDCHSVPVEARIIRDFNWAERKTWNRGYTLIRLSGAHEHRTKQYEGSVVTRRYCMARAHFTNGDQRMVYFMVSDIGGFVGQNWDVTHCVAGLEPWRNHGGNCRTMR